MEVSVSAWRTMQSIFAVCDFFSKFGCGNKQLILYLKVLLLLPLYPVQYLLLLYFLQGVILFSQTLVLRKCQHLIDWILIVWCTYYVTKVIYCHMYWMQCFSSKVVMQPICRLGSSFLWSLKKVTNVVCSNEELIYMIMLHLIAGFVGTVDDFITKWILTHWHTTFYNTWRTYIYIYIYIYIWSAYSWCF